MTLRRIDSAAQTFGELVALERFGVHTADMNGSTAIMPREKPLNAEARARVPTPVQSSCPLRGHRRLVPPRSGRGHALGLCRPAQAGTGRGRSASGKGWIRHRVATPRGSGATIQELSVLSGAGLSCGTPMSRQVAPSPRAVAVGMTSPGPGRSLRLRDGCSHLVI